MPNWKKLIVSGSDATLNNLNVTNAVTASFFKGDGSALTGISTGTSNYTDLTNIPGGIISSSTFNQNISIAKTDPTLTLFDNSGANSDPSGKIVFSEFNNSNNFEISYNGVNDRLEFIGLISSTPTDLVYINRNATTPLTVKGGATFDGGIQLVDSNTTLTQYDSNGSLQIDTQHGYVRLGPNNSSYSHFDTDRGKFYFSKRITVDEGILSSYNDDLQLQSPEGSTRLTLDKDTGHATFTNAVSASNLHIEGNSFIDAAVSAATLTLGRYSGKPTIKAGTDDSGYMLIDSSGGFTGLNWYSGDDVILVNGGGNVGIGTTSPSTKLDVNGTVTATAFAGDGSGLTGITDTNTQLSNAEVRTAVEAATNSNVFTDADHTKLNSVETNATADQSASEILTSIKTVDGSGSGLDADTLDGIDSTDFYRQIAENQNTVGPGWMTVARSSNARGHADIIVSDGDSGDHGFIQVNWLRSYNDSSFTVTNTGGHQNRITGVRVLQESADVTYGNKYLQVYVTVSSTYYTRINKFGNPGAYTTNFTAPTPVIENTKTGYAVKGTSLTSLSDYNFGAEQGVETNKLKVLDESILTGNVGIGTASPAVSLDVSATDAVQMPVGLTGDRPAGANGMLRYNSTNNGFEGYINGNWGDIGGGSSGGLIFRGTFDASNGSITGGGNLYTCPTGGPGGTVDIAVGDLYIVTTAGSFYCSGTSLNIGDEVICITAATAGNSSVTDWNAVASGAGGAVTGSGTTNYVPKFTGATVVGNSSIFNDASGNVGIGTTSPVEKLYVNSTSGDARIGLNAPTGSDTEIKFSNAGVVQYSIGHDDATDNFVIGTANVDTPKVSITSAGNVGIGTTSPGAKLDVSGNGKFTIQSGAINNTAPDAVTLSNVTTAAHAAGLGASLKFDFTNSTSSYAGSVISSESNADPNTSDLVFKPRNYGNAEAMRIDSSGNVGIGTTAPNAKLHIKETTASTSQIKMSAASNEANYGYLTMTDNTINTAKLTLGTTFGYNVEVPAITIFNGEVCIGTTNPTEKLQVDGNIRAVTSGETKIKIRGSGDSSDLNLVSQNQTFFVKRGASERMTIDSSGNVGIGTSSPGARLEVVEASPTNGIVADFVNSTNAGGTTAAIKLSNTTLDSCDVILGANRVGANFGSDFFISLSDSVDGTIQERFRITEAGKVGIGTDQPEVSLHISATDAILVPTGTTNDRPSGILPGMIRYNTSTNEFEGYSGTLNVSGSWGALGGSSGAPTITKDLFQVTTAQSIFNLTAGVNPQDANYVNIFIDGVYQNSGTYTVATATGTTTVNLNTAAPVGTSVEIISTT